LAGHWFACACGLEEVVPAEHARCALKKIFEFNVKRFRGGDSGALNGMRPNGKLDTTSLQAQEMWAGTTYSIAACMLQEGLCEEAFATAKGVYLAFFRDLGLFFQTPEALDVNDGYRAVGYMRPLAIWAMQWALERKRAGER
jgi:non-lysosomal glucosylceramidase